MLPLVPQPCHQSFASTLDLVCALEVQVLTGVDPPYKTETPGMVCFHFLKDALVSLLTCFQ